MTPESIYTQLISKLDRLQNKTIFYHFCRGILNILIWLMPVTAVFISLEAVLYFTPQVKIPLFAAWCLSMIILLPVYFREPVSAFFKRKQLTSYLMQAERVGKNFGENGDRLKNIIQLYSQKDQKDRQTSPALIDQALIKYGEPALKHDFNTLVTFRNLQNRILVTVLFFFCGFLLLSIQQTGFLAAFGRFTSPKSAYSKPLPFSVTVQPGTSRSIKGSDIGISVKIDGEPPDNVILYKKNAGQVQYHPQNFQKLSENNYNIVLADINDPFDYYVFCELDGALFSRTKYQSEVYHISLLARPEVTTFNVSLKHPRYSGIPDKTLPENTGNINALKGTRAAFSFTVNKPVTEATVLFQSGDSQNVSIRNNSLSAAFPIIKSDRYWLRLKGADGLYNEQPIKYKISAIPDEFPFINVLLPGRDSDIGEDQLISFILKAGDDFGISSLRLAYEKIMPDQGKIGLKPQIQYLNLPVKNRSGTPHEVFFTWHLDDLGLIPDDRIKYHFEIFDNDRISGPKKSVSETYFARYPSLYEIFSEVENEQNNQIEEMESLIKESRDLQETLKSVARELKRSHELDWQKKKTLDNTIKKQNTVNKKLDQVEKKMDELVEKIEKNDLTARETLKKYLEIQKLLKDIRSTRLDQTMRKLKESMEKLNTPDLQQQTQNMQANQERFLKKLERTYNLLKQIQLEQKMDEIVKKSEELLNRQIDINEKVQKGNSGEEQIKREQKLSQDTGNLKQSLESLIASVKEMPEISPEKLEQASREIEQKKIAADMKDMSDQMKQNKQKEASQKGEKIEQNLQELNKSLQQARNQMREKQKQAVQNVLNKAINELIALSRKQENLKNDTRSLSPVSPKITENAQKQNNLRSALSRITNRLVELSNKTFYVTPEIGESINKAHSGMQQSIHALEDRNPGNSGQMQNEAVGALNETAMNLRNSLNALKKSSSASGMEQYLKQLQKLTEQQQQLNQQMQQGNGNPFNQQMMQQFAQEQEIIRRALEKMLNQMGKNRGFMKDLDEVGKAMGEVEKDLSSRKMSPQTKMKQREIVQRLLDAQKSLFKQEYSKKRKSDTAKDYATRDPLSLPANYGEAEDFLKAWKEAALREGYSNETKALIEQYFEELKNVLKNGKEKK